ncbi:MAG TPA: RluA family pseudouridine synthase [Haloplasmataceae bacterium]
MIFTYIIDEKEISIKDYLIKQLYSQKLLSALKNKGGKIMVNGKEKRLDDMLYVNDLLEVIHPKEEISNHFEASKEPINIIYEDDYLLIVSKPVHLETIPSRLNNHDTLANRVKYFFTCHNIISNIHVITRLDKETSGLVMIAKNRYIHHLFSNHVKITKKYQALVEGTLNEDLYIEANIMRENEKSIKRVINPLGKKAKTFVKVLKVFIDKTLVECTLFTGRTHQIRVHLQYINHPIIGDLLYQGKEASRLHLHCHYLSFYHPLLKKDLEITDMIDFSHNK